MKERIERIETLKIKIDKEFFVLIIPEKESRECWLMKEDNSFALYMFGLCDDEDTVIQIARANAKNYIELWNKELWAMEEHCFEDEAGVSFEDFYKNSGMTILEISKRFGIPYRTVQNWAYGHRKCPDYLLELMKYKLKRETDIKERLKELVNKDAHE